MTREQPLRIGMVGLGRQMTEVLAPTLATIGGVEIVGVCDIDPRAIERFGRVYRVPESFADAGSMVDATRPDGVLLAVGHDANATILDAILSGDAHAFVEKTPVASVEEAERLAIRQDETNRYVMVGFNRRFTAGARAAAAAANSPEFGRVHLFQSQFHATRYCERAFIVNHIIHHLDLARFLLGELDLTSVQRIRVADQELGYTISFRAVSGAIGSIQAGSFLDPTFPVERFEIVGTGGNVVVDQRGVTVNMPPGTATASASHLSWKPTAYRAPHRNLVGYEEELRHFTDCVRTGARPSPDIADSVKTMQLVEQMTELAVD